jgi:hypothetical protein
MVVNGINYIDGQKILVGHICMSDLPAREVIFEVKNGIAGVRVNVHWFRWGFFFEVNFIK